MKLFKISPSNTSTKLLIIGKMLSHGGTVMTAHPLFRSSCLLCLITLDNHPITLDDHPVTFLDHLFHPQSPKHPRYRLFHPWVQSLHPGSLSQNRAKTAKRLVPGGPMVRRALLN